METLAVYVFPAAEMWSATRPGREEAVKKKKATQRGSSPLAAVCSPHHILRFLSGFTGFSPPASFSPSQFHKVVPPAEILLDCGEDPGFHVTSK